MCAPVVACRSACEDDDDERGGELCCCWCLDGPLGVEVVAVVDDNRFIMRNGL